MLWLGLIVGLVVIGVFAYRKYKNKTSENWESYLGI
jgi:hypothetical protein